MLEATPLESLSSLSFRVVSLLGPRYLVARVHGRPARFLPWSPSSRALSSANCELGGFTNTIPKDYPWLSLGLQQVNRVGSAISTKLLGANELRSGPLVADMRACRIPGENQEH